MHGCSLLGYQSPSQRDCSFLLWLFGSAGHFFTIIRQGDANPKRPPLAFFLQSREYEPTFLAGSEGRATASEVRIAVEDPAKMV